MKPRHALPMFLVAALGAQLACSSKAVGPVDALDQDATEPLPLTFLVRWPIFRERLPALEVSGLAGSIRVEVARPAIGCTVGRAFVGRQPGVLTFVARVGANPAAVCLEGQVVEYAGVIEGIAAGRYTVHVYEAVASGSPVRLGTRTVAVLPAPT